MVVGVNRALPTSPILIQCASKKHQKTMCFAARSHSFKTSSLLHKVGEEVLQEKAPSPLQSGGSPDVCGEFGEVPQIQSTDP